MSTNFGPCPECDAELHVTIGDGGGPIAIGHTSPPCARFIRTEAEDFLTWVLDVREAARRGVAGDA